MAALINKLAGMLLLAALGACWGCAQEAAQTPVWDQVKLGDLAEPAMRGRQRLETTNLTVAVVDIPADKLGGLDSIWPQMYVGPLHFEDRQAFVDNGFRAAFGRDRMLEEITERLLELGQKRAVESTSLMMNLDEPSFVGITRPPKPNFLYKNSDGLFESVKSGSGQVAIRLLASRVDGGRGVVKMEVTPAVGWAYGQPQMLSPVGFELRMSPGDFVLLAPERFLPHQATLESVFFSRNRPLESVQVFILLCTRISE